MMLRFSIAFLCLLLGPLGFAQQRMTPIQKLANLTIPELEFAETPLGTAIDFLRAKSVDLDPTGAGVNFVISNTVDKTVPVTLRLRNAPIGDALRYLTELSRTSFKVDRVAVQIQPRDPEVSVPTQSSTSRLAGQLTQKMRAMQLTSIELSDTPLATAVDFLEGKSLELDPSKRGINFVIGDGVNREVPVSLRLNNVPLSTALGYVVQLSNNRIRVDPRAIVILPPQAALSQ
ncbi:MAG: hypothetical protein AAGH89_11075 [Verrucomicrobiota bacterium]